MRITVLLFANLAEQVGRDRLEVDVRDGANVSDAMDQLAAAHDSIARSRPSLAVAVDEAYATTSTVLRDGCTLALIPPVSGG